MVEFTRDGILLSGDDLSNISPDSEDNGRIFRHDGSSTIPIRNGNETSEPGLYHWDHNDRVWYPVGRYSLLLDGYTSDELAKQDDFEDQVETHDQLREDHDQLESDHSTLLADKNTLRQEHDSLSDDVTSHTSDIENPHGVDNEQVGAPTQSEHDLLRSDYDSHESNTENPHGVTTGQIEAATESEHDLLRSDYDSHENNLQNPHSVTTEQIDAISKDEKGYSGGVAELNDDSTVPDSQLPSLAVTDVNVLEGNEEHTDLIDAEPGDMAIYADDDEKGTYILSGSDPTVNSDWTEVKHPESPVQSIFGRDGDVSAESGDYDHDQIGNVSTDDHHSRYTDSESRVAVDGSNIDIQGVAESTQDHLNSVESSFLSHEQNEQNPHSVTRSQIGAASETEFESHQSDTDNPHNVTNEQVGSPTQSEFNTLNSDFESHESDTNNPHNVTVEDTGGITSEQADEIHIGPDEPVEPTENMIWIQTET